MPYTQPTSLVPDTEPQRLRTLYHYRILNTTPELVFDHLVALAAQLLRQPIALISLVDAEEVFFKANTGLPGLERVARADSLCSAAVLEADTLVFNDLEQERCELVNPAVAEAAGLRFYAGAPLRMPEGANIGTFCVIGREPRMAFSAAESALLAQLAALVGLTIELRRQCPDAQSWDDEQVRLLAELAELAAYSRYLDVRLSGPETPEAAQVLSTRLQAVETFVQQRLAARR